MSLKNLIRATAVAAMTIAPVHASPQYIPEPIVQFVESPTIEQLVDQMMHDVAPALVERAEPIEPRLSLPSADPIRISQKDYDTRKCQLIWQDTNKNTLMQNKDMPAFWVDQFYKHGVGENWQRAIVYSISGSDLNPWMRCLPARGLADTWWVAHKDHYNDYWRKYPDVMEKYVKGKPWNAQLLHEPHFATIAMIDELKRGINAEGQPSADEWRPFRWVFYRPTDSRRSYQEEYGRWRPIMKTIEEEWMPGWESNHYFTPESVEYAKRKYQPIVLTQ